jgi:hypothetical protein
MDDVNTHVRKRVEISLRYYNSHKCKYLQAPTPLLHPFARRLTYWADNKMPLGTLKDDDFIAYLLLRSRTLSKEPCVMPFAVINKHESLSEQSFG